jgi:PAS domain S-box-containing protein
MPTPQCQLAKKMRAQSCGAFAQHQLHHAVFDSSPSGLTVLDAQGKIVESNPAAKRIFGRTTLDGRTYDESDWLIRDLDGKPIPIAELPFEIVRRTGKPISNFRHSIRTAEGGVVYLSISGQPLFDDSNTFGGAVFSVTDITAEILAQKQIAETQQRYELAILGTGLGTWDWHIPTGRVVFNDTWATMLGYSPTEVAPHVDSWVALVHPDDAATAGSRLQEHFAGLTENYECEHRVRAKSGEYRWILDRGRVITRDEQGAPIRMVGTHQDTTDRRRAEEELRRAKDAAEAANRAKGEFLANISHEIRTPMNAILGFADVLRDPTLTADERNEHIATIRRNSEHLMSLLNDVLDLSKIEAGALTVERLRVSPVAIIQDTAALMRLRCESKGLSFHVRIAPGLPASILADPTRLRQILLNLLGNAIKFTHTGSVTLECRCDAGMLAIRVIDTGIGISPEDRDRLFLPFTQADMTVTRRFGGTGLGLTISRRLASLMVGQLSVESRVHVGSTFTLTLPLDASSEAEADRAASADAGDAAHLVGRRVLIVDDAPDNQLLLRYLLSRRGIECELAADGDAAIARARESVFDAILMDMQMPVLDGYSATRALRRAGVTIPIIALTANALAGDDQRCRDAGCDFHLTKPVHASRLIQMLAQAIPSVPHANV